MLNQSAVQMKTRIPVSSPIKWTADRIAAASATVRAGQIVKHISRTVVPSTSAHAANVSRIPVSTTTATNTKTMSWQPPKMAALPSFAFGTKVTTKVDNQPATTADKRKATLKGHEPNTSRITSRNATILKGVRSNRRFDLQMKFRQESQDDA